MSLSNRTAPVLCVGATHWDTLGMAATSAGRGADVAGRIMRQPGGVALNIARAIRSFGLDSLLITAVGRDAAGKELIESTARYGVCVDYIHRPERCPTDRYVAVEDTAGLVAAVADARTLERAGSRILEPLENGSLASADRPWTGLAVVDGNLPDMVLRQIATSRVFSRADLRIVAASPHKAPRISAFFGNARSTLYMNLQEASAVLECEFDSSRSAAVAISTMHGVRSLVTDGPHEVSFAFRDACSTVQPPPIEARRATGAGDRLAAAHAVAEIRGEDPLSALEFAVRAASRHVSENGEQGQWS